MLYPNMPSVREGSVWTGFSFRNEAVAEEFRSVTGPCELDGARNW